MISTLTHYSDIVSDISSGRICGIYVLTYYLTFFSEILFDILSGILFGIYSDILSGIYYILILPCHEFGLGVLLFAWINANGLNIHQMLVSHVCTQWLPLPLIPQNGQVLNLRVGPEKFSGYWKNRTLAQGLKKDVGGRFRYAVGLQSWVNRLRATTACNFSSLIFPDVSAPAALASLLFNPPEPQNHEKTQCFVTFLPFRASASSFFWSFLFWLFSLLTAFSSLHIVGSLTSKLPSIMLYLPNWWFQNIRDAISVTKGCNVGHKETENSCLPQIWDDTPEHTCFYCEHQTVIFE